MARVENSTCFPHLLYRKTGLRDQSWDVLAVRGTFDWGDEHEPAPRASQQTPLVWGEEYAGPSQDDPLRSVVVRDGDLSPGKPGSDVHVLGRLRAPNEKPLASWLAAVRVGPVKKIVRVHGPRRFVRRFWGWQLTHATPVAAVPLDYRLAFGGCYSHRPDAQEESHDVYHEPNPAGCGWLPAERDLSEIPRASRRAIRAQVSRLREMAAPQIEDSITHVRHPYQRLRPEGFGPIARWWTPRVLEQGTLDARWRQHRYPLLPLDFNPQYNQSAHPDLRCRGYLQGDETVAMAGCCAEGTVKMRLPGVVVYSVARLESGKLQTVALVLDTVVIDLDHRHLALTWRGLFCRDDPVTDVALGVMTTSRWHQLEGLSRG